VIWPIQVVSADKDPIQIDCEHPAVAEHCICRAAPRARADGMA